MPIGASENLRVGQRVYTLGNPFGLEGTLTTGIISNLNRTLPSRTGHDMKSIIQTDAAMNPGNSGGPLLDTGGRMVGMNVAIATKTGQNAGLGFAIPINRIRQIVPQLIEHGKVVRADIGIVAVKVLSNGLQIVEVNKGGPAEKAGLLGWKTVRRRVTRGPLAYDVERQDTTNADVIVAVGGQPVDSAGAFVDMIEEHQPGDQLMLTILRQGRQIEVPVTLGSTIRRTGDVLSDAQVACNTQNSQAIHFHHFNSLSDWHEDFFGGPGCSCCRHAGDSKSLVSTG